MKPVFLCTQMMIGAERGGEELGAWEGAHDGKDAQPPEPGGGQVGLFGRGRRVNFGVCFFRV